MPNEMGIYSISELRNMTQLDLIKVVRASQLGDENSINVYNTYNENRDLSHENYELKKDITKLKKLVDTNLVDSLIKNPNYPATNWMCRLSENSAHTFIKCSTGYRSITKKNEITLYPDQRICIDVDGFKGCVKVGFGLLKD